MNIDLSFYTWDLISKYVLNGFLFSIELTIIATLGGIFFGTLLALMRLSGKSYLDIPASIYVNLMRSIPLVMVILWFTALQTHVPKQAIGRVSAYDAFGSLMFGPIGLALAGPLSQLYGTQPVLICAGALTVVMVGLSFLSKEVRDLRYVSPSAEAEPQPA